MTATALVLAKGNLQKSVEMKPAGENKLAGVVDFAVEGKFRAAVTLRNASGEIGKARYNLDANRLAGGTATAPGLWPGLVPAVDAGMPSDGASSIPHLSVSVGRAGAPYGRRYWLAVE